MDKSCCKPTGKNPNVTKYKKLAQPVTIEGPIEISNFPPDYEYTTSTVCDLTTNTWHSIVTPLVDGVAGTPVDTDLGISCDEPKPVDVELFEVELCVNGEKVIEVRQKNFDEDGNAAPSTVIETFNTGIDCVTEYVDTETQSFPICVNGENQTVILKRVDSLIDGSQVSDWTITHIITPSGISTATAIPAGATIGVCAVTAALKGEDCAGDTIQADGYYVKHVGKIEADLCSAIDTESKKFDFCDSGVSKQAIIEKQNSIVDGTVVSDWAITHLIDETGAISAATSLPAGATLGVCVIPDECPLTREVYRISGTASGTSTNLRGGGGVVGNTVTIAAPFKSIGTNILRQTMQDPGDGSIAMIEVDGVEYHMGQGNAYYTDIMDWATNDCSEYYTEDITFTATGEAHLEILVTYK